MDNDAEGLAIPLTLTARVLPSFLRLNWGFLR